VAVCVVFLADPQFIERQQGTYEDGSAQGRLEAWREAGRMLSDRPLGAGARGFHLLIPKYSEVINERHGGEPRSPHNTYILVMVEYGAIGIFLWMSLLGSIFWMLLRTRRIGVTVLLR
jgi:O-antigen ligase